MSWAALLAIFDPLTRLGRTAFIRAEDFPAALDGGLEALGEATQYRPIPCYQRDGKAEC
jgi:hypothetical protein